MGAHSILLVCAAVSFGLGAASVPNVNWLCLGLCFGTISLLV